MQLAGLAGALSLVAVLSAACADDSSSGIQPPGEQTGLSGTAKAVQDVEGLPEQELDSGWVVAVPQASVPALWEAAGSTPADDDELPYFAARLSREQVAAAGGSVAVIADGRFTLDGPAGDAVVCLLVQAGAGERTRGCDRADLPAAGELSLTVGEAGVRVEVVG